MTNGDTIVVLRSVNKLYATKQFTFIPGKKGKPDQIRNKSYGNEKFFSVDEIPIANAAVFHHVLEHLTRDPFTFIIRGAPLPGINRHYTRRLLHKDPKTGEEPNFAPQPRRWLTVDCDHLPEPPLTDLVNRPVDAVQHVIGRLPPELHDVTCFWQLSSSAGLPSSEGSLSLHLWYWCARPYGDEELSRWAAFVNREDRLVDSAVYRPVQPHYIAAPLFSGMADPLPQRHGIWQGLDDELELIIPPPAPHDPTHVSPGGYEPGIGVEAFLAQIGGPTGFRDPIVRAIGSYIAIHGEGATCEPLKEMIRKVIDAAEPGGRDQDTLERYKSDKHLDEIIAWVRAQHGDQPPKGFIPPVPPHLDDPPPADPNDQPPAPTCGRSFKPAAAACRKRSTKRNGS